jgi:hypothetical protein
MSEWPAPKYSDEDAKRLAGDVSVFLPGNLTAVGKTFDLGDKIGVAIKVGDKRVAVRALGESASEPRWLAKALLEMAFSD